MPPLRPGAGPAPTPGGRPPQRGPIPPGGDPRGPQPPRGPGGQPPRRPGPPQRPGPGAPNGAQATQKIPAPTRPRPAGEGTNTGSRRATSGAVPPGPPPRRGGGSGGPGGPGGRRPAAQKRSRWRTVRRVLYILVALGFLLPSAAFLVAYSTVSVPQPGDLKTKQVATIFAADGNSVIGKIVPPQGNRTDVTINDIPVHVRNAVIAAEDRSFYTNPGFSISGFARAIRDNAMGKETAGGGSTITQQYVKNSMVGNQHSLSRKVRELVISAKMAREWSKDDILTAYLNTIPFGRGTFGIDAASHAYFGKKVQDLTVEEGAMLAATINQPYGLDPENNPKGAEQRWNYVLNGMVDMGALPAADRAKMVYPKVLPSSAADQSSSGSGPEGLIKQQVMRELAAAGISDTQINTEGLQITTTIDPKAQQAAVDAAQKNMKGEPDNLRSAVVSVDPRTGAVKAYYGGDNGVGFDFANAPGVMPGSSFKVFALAANLERGKPLSTMYDSAPLDYRGIKITNVEGEACGVCTIAQALKLSLNTSFYRMELDMGESTGPQKIADMAHRMGIPDQIPGQDGKSLTEKDGGPNTGIVLGAYPVPPLYMASAYATIANNGMYHKPHFVQKVETADHQVLLDRGTVAGEQRVSGAVTSNLIDAMKPIAQSSRNHGLAGGRLSASKTGTAQLGDGGDANGNRDAWMVGFTPSLSTAVWVGTETGTERLINASGSPIYGSGLPADIWKSTMDTALKGTTNEDFPKPEPIAGQAGVPSWTAAYTPPSTTAEQYQPPVVVRPTEVEVLPGVRIPVPGLAPNPQSPPQRQQRSQPEDSGAGPLPGQPVAPADGSSPTTTDSGGTDPYSRGGAYPSGTASPYSGGRGR
ncbi:penicillin-binding protein [Nocardia terpenica]|uniref:transglycosylase domain-containing protein n=1 Tax=Nocardia terpenica TaxID=455432 RepID=UPI00189586A1|nr:transglycosylase domain-containing protein [Nocardia terpenica]MBF6062934.1 penicillin-binding protein [Nocardia terpenica]MBF6104931.1 penicillin-binding protein [Nocardia terpenica]MBF6112632.1 penicillin-binding protein [Nocardia terpenica]MBF6118659.1 penicillin-binding protein [Nocardia terpenica]MBF6155138.1 penicillin-binding protein [Nocardia terpenica]